MKTLVTGALGFIGSAYVRGSRAHSAGVDDMVLLARPSSRRFLARLGGPGDLVNETIFRWLDLARDDLSDAVADCDKVVHLAAKTFVDRSIADPAPFIDSNIVGSYRLLEALRRSRTTVRRIYWQSTDEVYGAILEGAYREDAALNPTNPYAATKAASDALALSYVHSYGLPIVIGRAENVYGPYQGREKVLPTFVRAALSGEPLPVYGDGQHARQWIHVDDVVDAIDHLLAFSGGVGQVYHVAGAQELKNLELAHLVLRALGRSGDLDRMVRFVPDAGVRPGHDRRYALATEKVRASGWAPTRVLVTSMAEVVQWYADHTEWTFG
jgi:dTDP-glucose 4,6-dehydratase